LYRRKAAASRTGGRAGIFIYFASLGLGFIIAEITLLQKFMVFLGGPAYSMAITLFTILLFSGLGSFLSRNWAGRPFRLLAMVMPLLVAVIIASAFLLDPIIARSANLSHFQRILMAVGLMAPLGLLMGMPFPAGLRFVDQFRPELNPWAWGINACATVIGTVVCILITLIFGFRLALLAGAVCYFIGWLIFTVSERCSQESTTSHRVT
jgi:MFS family permease